MTDVRILYVISGLARGGAEKQLYLLLKHLDRRRFAPTVVSLSGGGPWAAPVRELGVPVIELTRHRRFELRRLLALYRIARRLAPDILQTTLLFDNVYGLLAGRLALVPVLVASRRIDEYGESPFVEAVDRWLARWAAAIICNAEASRRRLDPALARRCVVISNGIEDTVSPRPPAVARQILGLPSTGLVVGTAGRLAAGKNQRLFIDVAADVAQSHPDVAFAVMGGGALAATLRAYGAERGLGGRLWFTGERAGAGQLMTAFDVFLLTSDREGMPNALMEAMLAGLPCVVTDAGASKEVVLPGVTGYVCGRGDRRGLAAGVRRLLDDAGLRRRLGESGRARVGVDFSAARMARETAALYGSLVGRARSGLSPRARPELGRREGAVAR